MCLPALLRPPWYLPSLIIVTCIVSACVSYHCWGIKVLGKNPLRPTCGGGNWTLACVKLAMISHYKYPYIATIYRPLLHSSSACLLPLASYLLLFGPLQSVCYLLTSLKRHSIIYTLPGNASHSHYHSASRSDLDREGQCVDFLRSCHPKRSYHLSVDYFGLWRSRYSRHLRWSLG